MINYKIGDALHYTYDKPTLLCHIVNSENRFGSGFAYAVAKTYPKVKSEYHDWYQNTMFPCELQGGDVPFMLGQIQPIEIDWRVTIVNMLAQGRPGGNTYKIGDDSVYLRPIRLDSLRECLYNVAVLAKEFNMEVAGPMFGAALAGGNWESEIMPLIEECLCKFDIPVTIFKLG